MDAIHIKTSGFYCGACPQVVEKALKGTDGIAKVVAVRSLGLTSVLYDPGVISREDVCVRIRSAGFGAEVLCPEKSDACDGD